MQWKITWQMNFYNQNSIQIHNSFTTEISALKNNEHSHDKWILLIMFSFGSMTHYSVKISAFIYTEKSHEKWMFSNRIPCK
jgi:hypothetical protein